MQRLRDRDYLVRAGLLVVVSTMALTASFVGVLALVTGQAQGVGDRLPFYVLAMAVAFVAAVLLFEQEIRDGDAIILSAGGVGLGTFVLVSFAGEGVAYAVREPEPVVASQLLLYFLAAGLIGTGVAYWGVRHWREFSSHAGSGSRSGPGL